jgi:hypothetical protein
MDDLTRERYPFDVPWWESWRDPAPNPATLERRRLAALEADRALVRAIADYGRAA